MKRPKRGNFQSFPKKQRDTTAWHLADVETFQDKRDPRLAKEEARVEFNTLPSSPLTHQMNRSFEGSLISKVAALFAFSNQQLKSEFGMQENILFHRASKGENVQQQHKNGFFWQQLEFLNSKATTNATNLLSKTCGTIQQEPEQTF